MNDKFHDRLRKDIQEFEEKYPNQIYTPKAIKELQPIKDKWLKINNTEEK